MVNHINQMVKKSQTTQARIADVAKELVNGKDRAYILSKYAKKWQCSPRSLDRYIASAQQEAKEVQELKKKAEADALYETTKDAEKRRIMTVEERKEYLTKIINGEIDIPYTDVKWDQKQKKFVTIKFSELSSHPARISAIAELNKMDGSYAPTKIAQTDSTGTQDIIPVIKVYPVMPKNDDDD